jgi:hypothetical protein
VRTTRIEATSVLCVQQARSRLLLLSHCDSSALDCAIMGSASHTTAVGIHALGTSSFGTQLDLYAGGGVSSMYEPGICAFAGGCGACGIASGTLISAASERVTVIAGTFLSPSAH